MNDSYPASQPTHGSWQIVNISELRPGQEVDVHMIWDAKSRKSRLTVETVDAEEGYIKFREWHDECSLRDLGVLPYEGGRWHPQHWIQRTWHDLTDDEIKTALQHICAVSESDDEVKRRIKDELGCPHGADVTSTSHGSMIMFMVMVHGPRGNTITK